MQICSPNSYFLGVQRKINEAVDLDRNAPNTEQILSGGTYHLDAKPQRILTINSPSKISNSLKKRSFLLQKDNCNDFRHWSFQMKI